MIGTIYILYKLFIKNEKILSKKIDIIILIFFLSPIIPLAFRTYSSLEETLISIIKYISLFNLYILLKDTLIKKENWSINLIIAGGTILALFGIDEMTSRIVVNYIDILNLPNVINYENRMFSILGYANSFAIIMAISLLLAISKCRKSKEVYSGLSFLFLSALLLSYSRSVLVIFLIILMIYFLILKKCRKIYLICIFSINLIFSLVYVKIFEMQIQNEHYIFIWMITIIIFLLSIFIAKLITKKYKVICMVKTKVYIGVFIFIIVLTGIIYFMGKKYDVPLQIFTYGEENNEVRYNVYNIIPNQHYTFTFDIDAKSMLNNIENYSIKIIEENKYYDTVNTYEIKFNNYTGIKTIEFTTSEETYSVALLFNNSIKAAQQGLTINSLYINDNKFILEYLYLPVKLVQRIENFTLENKSILERITFYKDGLKIASENLLTGTGGKGWLYNYENVQSYVYSTTEIHNYFLQILIENGIISALALISIILYSIICIFRRWKKRKCKITDFAFILLGTHSLLDFDMSFYCIMVIWLLLLNFTLKEENNNYEKDMKIYSKTSNVLSQLISIGIIALNITIIILGIYLFRLKQYNADIKEYLNIMTINQNYNETIELIEKYKINEKYNKFYDIVKDINYKNVSTENIEYIYNDLKNQAIVVNTEYNIERNLVIKQILETSENKDILSKFSNIIIEENEQIIENIKNRDKNRLTKEKIEEYLNLQKEIYELALEKLK